MRIADKAPKLRLDGPWSENVADCFKGPLAVVKPIERSGPLETEKGRWKRKKAGVCGTKGAVFSKGRF